MFLPEPDQEILRVKELCFQPLTETLPDGTSRRGILFPAYSFVGSLFEETQGQLKSRSDCDLLILIPSGYSTTKLDSFYTFPRLKKADGSDPNCAASMQTLFAREWQFWSRHLTDSEWRPGQDGIDTFLQYVRSELRRA